MSFTSRIAASLLLGCLMLSPSRDTSGQEPDKPAPAAKITWKLQALDQAPFKVVSAQSDPKTRQYYWVIELLRDLSVYEDSGHWAPAFKQGGRTRFRFEFHDADGIVLATVNGRYIGDYVNKSGKRFGTLLEIPPDLASRTRTIEAIGY